MISKVAFTEFMAENGSKYPHNEIRRTRGGLYPRWLLLEADGDVSLFRPRGYFLLRTSCISNSLMQQIIVHKEGMPLPNDCNEVADVMEYWGLGVSGRWQQNVLHMMHELLTAGDAMETRHFFCQCIVMIVERRVREAFNNDNSVVTDVVESFQIHFCDLCHTQTRDFYDLALAAFSFVNAIVDMEQRITTATVIPAVVISEEDE